MAASTLVRLALLALLALPAAAQSTALPGVRDADLQEKRARWNGMSADERSKIQERYRDLMSMSAEQRRSTLERADELQRMREKLRAELSPEAAEAFGKLPTHKQRQMLNEEVRATTRAKGESLRDTLPPQFLDMLERASPQERPRMMGRFRSFVTDHVTRNMVEELVAALGRPPEEMQRLKGMRKPERMREVMAMLREYITRNVDEEGLPPGVEPDEWERWMALEEPFEFLEAFYGRTGPPHLGRAGRGARRWVPGRGSMQEADRETRMAAHQRLSLVRQLDALCNPQWSDKIGLDHLPHAERRRVVFERVRDRVLVFVRDDHPDLLPPDLLDRLVEHADDDGTKFRDTVREFVHREYRDFDERYGLPPGFRPRSPGSPRDMREGDPGRGRPGGRGRPSPGGPEDERSPPGRRGGP